MSFKRPNMPKKVSEREKAYIALLESRLKIIDKCRQLQKDIQCYNDHNPHDVVIDMLSFDFTSEVLNAEEKKQPSA